MPCFNNFKGDVLTGAISLSGDASSNLIAVILVSASWTPDIDAHTRYRDVSAHEVSVADPGRISGYVTGGQILSAGAFAVDTANDRGTWDNTSDITWPTSTITARYAVILKKRNSGANKELDNLISYHDFGSNQSSSSGNFTLQWNANGIVGVA